MAISIRCDNSACGKTLKVSENLVGKKIKCTGCDHLILVAYPEAITADPPAPPAIPVSPPPAYGAPPAEYGPPPGYGAPPQYGMPPGYGAPPGYGEPRFAAPRHRPQYHPGKPMSPLLWYICLGAMLACGILAIKAGHSVVTLESQLWNDPDVVAARLEFEKEQFDRNNRPFDPNFRPRHANVWNAEDEARRKVRERIQPTLSFWRGVLIPAILVGILVIISELVVYTFYISRRGVESISRWYTGSVLTFLGAAVLAGGTLLYAALSRESRFDDWRAEDDARNEMRQGRPGAFERFAEAHKRNHERWREADSRQGFAFAIFFFALIVAVRAGLGVDILFLVMIYKLWARVQDGRAATTPGMAVGFLFIPFFNLYWMFVAIPGVANELNRCARYENLRVEPANWGLMLTTTILRFLPFLIVINLIISIFAVRSCARVGDALERAYAS